MYLSEGFTGDSEGKEYACNEEDLGLIPGSGRSAGERNGFQYSYLGESMDRDMWSQRVEHDQPSD